MMGLEIERKFLVDGDYVKKITANEHPMLITQGYILEDEETNTVLRVRLQAYATGMSEPRLGFITIKRGIDALRREEFEYEIPGEDAEHMLRTMCTTVITKIRRIVPCKHSMLNWEVDYFMNEEFDGLVIAEIELPSPDTEIFLPSWIREEVTDDPQYLNSNLIKRINT